MNEDEESAKAILSDLLYITLATVSSDGLPWNSPVFAAFDEAYQFFWVSASGVRHSQNIKVTHRVAIVVYDSTAPAGEGRGVYIEARADEVTNEQEIIHGLDALEKRGWKKPLEEVTGTSIHRLYQAVPEHMWITSVGSLNGQLFDARVAVDLLKKEG
jgi:nitroimidazol reductase NimA-like FMN-containing flavoprotein (pyridoxamine 5'-phosphate oxidase superfamily)